MNLKSILYQKGIKQVDLVKQLGVDPGRVSLQINCIRPLPEKYQEMLCKLIGISLEELNSLNKKGDQNETHKS